MLLQNKWSDATEFWTDSWQRKQAYLKFTP